MSILVYIAIVAVTPVVALFGWQAFTRHWNLANITSDLDNVVAQLEKHITFKAKQAGKLQSKATKASVKAQVALESSVQASKIASNVKALLGRE